MRASKFVSARFALFSLVALSAIASACSQIGDGTASSEGASGSLGLSLQLASGVALNSVTYTIVGPNGYLKTGSFDISQSSTVAGTISPIPAGVGYSVTLDASSTPAGTTCNGSAAFAVIGHQTSAVTVKLACHEAPRAGSVAVNGTLNICPSIDAVSASPAQALVGGSLQLQAAAHDADAGPAALSYHWTTTSGMLDNAAGQSPMFTCTASGAATVTLTVSDGDASSTCADVSTVTVSCVAPGAGTGGGAGASGVGGSTAGGGASGVAGAASGSGGVAGAVGGTGGAGTGGAAAGSGGANAGAGGAAAGSAGANAGAGGAAAGSAGANAGAGGAAAGSGGSAGSIGAGGSTGGSAAENVVVYRVGDGASSLASTGNPVFLDEYTSSGTPVRVTSLPTAATGTSHRLVASGTATSEGFLTRSTDGEYLILTGYDAAIPVTGGVAATLATASPRTIARLDASGNLDTTTALMDAASGNNPRSAVSSNGVDIWFAGASGGARYTTLGGSTSVQLSTTVVNLRQLEIFGGQLYTSDSSGPAVRVGAVGTGLPMVAGQTITNLPGFPASTGSPYAFFLADLDAAVAGLDTLYVADDGAGLLKYSLVQGSWASNGAVGSASDTYRGLTGVASGSSVTLFATRKGGSAATGGGELVVVLDPTGYNGAFAATPTTLVTAVNNTAFRGVAFAPKP